ncbi:MAG: hypothetical protein QXK24_00705 [Ignisphaera sp.]|uniref:VWA domain-containing protein n=1 Tax=Ignisphaera aggregans TaxID=334771 RepID=A0A7C4D3D1_9CREN
MRPALIEDYRDPTYRALARSVLSSLLLENKKVPFVVAMDSSIIHYKPWHQIVFNPNVKSAWRIILERYYNTEAYRKLNNIVAGDPMLAKYATIHFLNTLFKKSLEQLKQLKKTLSKKDEEDPVDSLLQVLTTQPSPETVKALRAVVGALEKEAEETLKDIDAIESFSHIGVPVANLLEKPDEFREKARNRIIVNLVRFIKKFMREAPNIKQLMSPTLVGGRPLGVKRIQRWSELPRALPMEYLDDDLLIYRIASRSLRVSEQYGGISNYVVYLDKSGSMAGDIRYYTSPTQYEHVPKISFAAAACLVLAYQLRKVGAKMTLKLFDVEVHDLITNFNQLIDILLKINADSGTNISNVLEDAIKYHRNDKIIVVTDGIDQVNEEVVKKAKSMNLDITFVFIKTDNELIRKYFKHRRVDEVRTPVLLEV